MSLYGYPMDRDNFLTVRTMAGHIPNDLLIDILSRLPVASLLRFRSVCKSWCSLITSPSFVTKHLKQSITNSKRMGDKLLIMTYDGNRNRYLLLRDDEKIGYECTELEFPFKHFYGYFRIIGCCNGLVCLSHLGFNVNPEVIIWNPSIRKSVTLPMPPDPQRHRFVVYGFGFHPKIHEYKVVRINYDEKVDNEHYYKIPPKAEVYEQGTSSWRGVSSAAPPYYIVVNNYCISHAFLNGAVHWVGYYHHEGGGFRNLIISFNMASESFSEIMLPSTLADQYRGSLSIKLYRESLVVLYNGERNVGTNCIWVMKEYGVAESWIKIFSSTLLGNMTMGIRKNGDVLLSSADSLASYAPGTKTLRDTGIRGISRLYCVDPFIETLVLAKERNDVSALNLS